MFDFEVVFEGKYIIYVYIVGSESYDIWEGKDRGS